MSLSWGAYIDLRSQLWFGLAAWLTEGGALPDHERMQELLVATYKAARLGQAGTPRSARSVVPKSKAPVGRS